MSVADTTSTVRCATVLAADAAGCGTALAPVTVDARSAGAGGCPVAEPRPVSGVGARSSGTTGSGGADTVTVGATPNAVDPTVAAIPGGACGGCNGNCAASMAPSGGDSNPSAAIDMPGGGARMPGLPGAVEKRARERWRDNARGGPPGGVICTPAGPSGGSDGGGGRAGGAGSPTILLAEAGGAAGRAGGCIASTAPAGADTAAATATADG